MLFNSFAFAAFFGVVLLVHGLAPARLRNAVLLLASYTFYGAWDVRFVPLLLVGSLATHAIALGLGARPGKAGRAWLCAGVLLHLGLLGFFKYCHFFLENLVALLATAGLHPRIVPFSPVLPVGISFFTFQAVAYLVDVRRGSLVPERSIVRTLLFLSFFPQHLAGPIERGSHLLPQLRERARPNFEAVSRGAVLILYGLFQKVVVADNLSGFVDATFGNVGAADGPKILVAAYAYAFQIFCDFSGYSDMARGVAALLGFDLVANFNAPYFARGPSEFWTRWHISLSSWLRDYLYVPLGGNRGGRLYTYRNLLLTMALGGLWHGASWTFVLWGAYHGCVLVAYRLAGEGRGKVKVEARGSAGTFGAIVQTVFFFHVVCVGWVIFRAASIAQLIEIARRFAESPWTIAAIRAVATEKIALPCLAVILVQYLQYRSGDPLVIMRWPKPVRALAYAALFYAIVLFGLNDAQSFIYLQF